LEQTLSPGGVCDLGSINLTQFINDARTGVNLDKIKKYVRYLNRFLDNVNDYSTESLPEYNQSKQQKRRIGIGILGWGSLLYMLKIRFASKEANELRDLIMDTISKEAYYSSIDLAEEKGAFPLCEFEKHASNPFVKGLNLKDEYINKLLAHGIRNSALLSCQPTGNCVTSIGKVKIGDDYKTIEELINSVISDISVLQEGDIVKLDAPIEIDTFEGLDSFDSIYVNGAQEVQEIIMTNGISLVHTPNHKFLVKISEHEADWIEAKDLKPGMKIISKIS